jgi:hypothetical protein
MDSNDQKVSILKQTLHSNLVSDENLRKFCEEYLKVWESKESYCLDFNVPGMAYYYRLPYGFHYNMNENQSIVGIYYRGKSVEVEDFITEISRIIQELEQRELDLETIVFKPNI